MRRFAIPGFIVVIAIALGCGPISQPNVDATVNAAVAGTLLAAQGANGNANDQPDLSATQPAPSGPSPTIRDCPIFPPDHIWNIRIDTLPVHPLSDDYIASIGEDVGLHPDFGSGEWEGGPIGIPYNVVSSDEVAAATISFYYPDESDPGPYPIPPDPLIEGGPDSEGDRHILIVDTATCTLAEIYDAYPQPDGSWEAGAGAVWDLNDTFLRPETWTSADAAGLPMLPGLVRYEEVAAGAINHALRFTADETQRAYVWPARHYASQITDESVPPMGQRFRLKASFDISPYPPEIQIILRAMQEYGLILADNGSNWFFTGAPDPRWNDEELVDTFRTIEGSNFEAVDVSGLMIDPDSGQAQTTP